MAKSMFDDLYQYLGSTSREPGYAYGNILPYRVKTDAQGNPIKGTGDWGLGYSNVAKGMFDTLMAPRQAMQGQSFTPEQAMNFAMNVTTPGVATARYVPGMFNMPIVYHGTPHRFAPTPDNPLGEFDASKIGTGEGAQAFGHGIYVAEERGVAKDYRDTLSKQYRADTNTYTFNNQPTTLNEFIFNAKNRHTELSKKDAEDAAFYATEFNEKHRDPFPPNSEIWDTPFGKAVASDMQGLKKTGGYLYTADYPDEMVDKMLDWDKPLSEQPEAVRKALLENSEISSEVQRLNAQRETLNAQNPQRLSHPVIGKLAKRETTAESLKGQSIYELLTKGRSQKEASEYLKSLGILGIKFLDEGSRAKGKGTRNFVLFPGDEKKAKIINRE